MSWFKQNYWNPGVTGRDTTPGGGRVFEGYARNGQRVGDASFLAGGNPGNRNSSDALRQLTGQSGMTDMAKWLSSMTDYNRENVHPDPNSKTPIWFQNGGIDVGGMSDFFQRGNGLANIDASVRGGGPGMGGFGGRIGGGRGGWDSANFMM
jgi:hypothetical protein